MGPHTPRLTVVQYSPEPHDRTAHLQSVLDTLTDAELTERLAGFHAMLAQLPGDDDLIRPTVAVLAGAIECELIVREREREAGI